MTCSNETGLAINISKLEREKMPKLLKTRFYLPPHKRDGFVLKKSPHGNEYYEQLPPASTVSAPGCKVVKGWKYFRDARRNLVLARLVINPANLHEILDGNLSSITPTFCEKYFILWPAHPVWYDPRLCFKVYTALNAFRDYKDSDFFKSLEHHMVTKLNFA